MTEQFPHYYADVSLIRNKFAGVVQEVIEATGEITIVVKPEGLEALMTWLRDEPTLRFNYLSDIGGVDLGEFASPRFAIAYQLYSLVHNHRLRVKVFLEEDNAVCPSLWNVWKASNWLEREIFDMFGVTFEGHPDLRRILMAQDFEGYPLRKDFPIRGF